MTLAALLDEMGAVLTRYADVTPETFIPSLRSMLEEVAALNSAYDGPASLTEARFGGQRCLVAKTPDASNDAVLYLHGGGYAAGSPETHAALLQALAERAKCAVIAVDYPLTPENGSEAILSAIRSAYDAIAQAHSGKIFVAGDSAGGALTLTLALSLKATGGRSPDALVPISPVTDLTLSGGSLRSKAEADPMLKAEMLAPLYGLFLGGKPADDPILSPLHGNLAGLPPTLIQVGENEVLLDDSLMFAERAKAAGVAVECTVWPGMFHVFQIFPTRLPEAGQALDEIAAFFKRV